MIIVASISIMIVFGISKPSIAADIPIIGNIFKLLENKITAPADYSKYANSINETAYSNGVSITLSEAVADGKNLYISYIIKSEEPFKYIPNKEEEFLIQELSMELKPSFNTNEGKFIDENTFIGVLTYNFYETSEDFKFKTEITSIQNYDVIKDGENYSINKNVENYIINGSWKFEVPIRVTEYITSIVEINDFGDSGIEYMKISQTPFNMEIDLDYDY